jgi:hypothetical protein
VKEGSAIGPISAWIFYFCTILRSVSCTGSGRAAAGLRIWALSGQFRTEAIWRKAGAASGLACARAWPGAVAAAVLAASLAGCGTISEQTAAIAFTSPGKYNIYSCEDVEKSMLTLRKRQVELEQLMARASLGFGGEFVNTIAYRGEYAQTRGQLAELTKAKADKQCATESKFSSGRAVF